MTIRPWQRIGQKFLLGGLLAWSGADALWAQPVPNDPAPSVAPQDPPVRRNYMNRNVIDLPITMDDPARALIQEIHLYAKDHPGAPWVLREKGQAQQKMFRFQAPRDGEFWFTMVTIDKQGRSFPQDMQNEAPGLIVVIDTQKPAVEMTNAGQTPQGQLVHCDVRDSNLDASRVRFFYQGGDKLFRPVDPVPGRPGVYCIPVQAVTTGVVRFIAEDLAGNQTLIEDRLENLQVRGPGTATTQQASVHPHAVPGTRGMDNTKPNQLPPEVKLAPDLEPDSRPLRTPQRLDWHKTVSNRPDGSDGPRYEATPPVVHSAQHNAPPVTQTENRMPSAVAPQKRQIVNNTKVFLDYQIEQASTKAPGVVEVWLTADHGKSWRKIAQDPQRRSPIEVQMPGDGLFGLMLMVSNGKGLSTGPTANDTPDWWIEVDMARPVARISNIQVAHESGRPAVTIQWTATDANLGQGPVDLFFGPTMQGPWLPIAKGLPAQGHHRWTPPAEIGTQAHIRLIARDVAGNAAIVNTMEPVNLEDPTRPRILIRNVRTETSSPGIAAPTPPGPPQIIHTPYR